MTEDGLEKGRWNFLMLKIERDRLGEMLLRAYEEGWAGCFEAGPDYVESILEKFKDEISLTDTSSLTITTSPTQSISGFSQISTSDIGFEDYYDYGRGTIFVNDPGEEI